MRPKTLLPEVALTPRQQEIATLVAAGYRNGEIADLLCISQRTVECHREHIAEQGLRGVADLTRYVIRQGWMTVA